MRRIRLADLLIVSSRPIDAGAFSIFLGLGDGRFDLSTHDGILGQEGPQKLPRRFRRRAKAYERNDSEKSIAAQARWHR